MFHHIADFFHQEGHRPFEKVHALGQVEWVHYVFVLFNVHFVVFDEDHGALVLVFTAIIGRAEDCNDRWEGLVPTPPMHLIAINLHLMRSNHRDEIVGPQDLLHWIQSKLHRTLSLWVRAKSHFSSVTVVHWVGPEQITQETLERWLDEAIHILDIGLGAQLRRNSTMHAKIIAIDICGDGHGLKALDK